ncbi:MAG TPA: M20/M25/M40 family metallo-hydrolase [Aeromicrobium sp.]|nr:M20/M25/M40 family metallo-hydrolase [Aeromicrobium sp.]
MSDSQDLEAAVAAAMPGVRATLEEMIAIPSIAFPGFDPEPVNRMAQRTVDAFAEIGVTARLEPIEGGYPAVCAEIPAPPGTPTVLMYAHYDVQPAPMEQGWDTDPFVATEVAGRIHGRGAADDKSGIAIHLATLAAFEGKPPVGVRLVIEGEEETISHLEAHVDKYPERFAADVMLVGDMGNLVVGEPVLSTALRGHVKAVVEIETLAAPVHSGLFGGAAPDALMTLIRLLDRLTDDNGDCAIPGIKSTPWDGAEFTEDMLRANAGVLDGVDLVGTGEVASRLWSKPSVTVLGIDAPSVAEAGNVLQNKAAAVVALRIPAGQDARDAMDKLVEFLTSQTPGNARVTVTENKLSPAFSQGTGGRAFAKMAVAMEQAYGRAVTTVGSGGSIPLLDTLRNASPDAEFILFGAQDQQKSAIHGPNESVDLLEIEKLALAQALLLRSLAEGN